MFSLLPASLTDERCRRFGWLILLGITAILYLPGLGTLPMMDRDEPRFAHATVEMIQRGSWAVPYFNGEYRFDKPPLTYWWMALHYKLLGINELAARLHTTFAVWLTAWAIFGIGRRLHSGRAGLMAGMSWLLTLQVLVHGRLCVADMPLVLFLTLALRAAVELLLSEQTAFGRWHWLFYLAMGFGFLAKGPLALLIPALALLLMRWPFKGGALSFGKLRLWPGLLISLAVAGAWGIPALIETQGLFWKVGMGEHVVERGTKAFNGRFPVPGYYLATAFLSLFPWIALLPQVWGAARREWTAARALLAGWFVAPYLIFTFYATQLPHYVLPGFPAAMVLLALASPLTRWPLWHKIWAFGCMLLFLVLGGGLLWGHSAFSWPEPLQPLLRDGAWLLLTLATAGALIAIAVALQLRWVFALGAGVYLGWSALLPPICQTIRATHPAVALAASLPDLPMKTECVGWQYAEPSLVFHFDRHWRFSGKLESTEKQLARSGPRVAVLLRREWTLATALQRVLKRETVRQPDKDYANEVDALSARHPTYQVSQWSGFNAARSSWVEITVLSRLEVTN